MPTPIICPPQLRSSGLPSPRIGNFLFHFWPVSFLIQCMRRLAHWMCLATSAVVGQSVADKLLQEAQKAPTLEKNLRVLTDEIGFDMWSDWESGKRGRSK